MRGFCVQKNDLGVIASGLDLDVVSHAFLVNKIHVHREKLSAYFRYAVVPHLH